MITMLHTYIPQCHYGPDHNGMYAQKVNNDWTQEEGPCWIHIIARGNLIDYPSKLPT
jgi:hypothetical protein